MKKTPAPCDPGDIIVGSRLRVELNEQVVTDLMESIQISGLINPIAVRRGKDAAGQDQIYLVAGRHRLEACKRLGLDSIDCTVIEGDETDARLLEISENLHRAELTPDERDAHIREWIALTAKGGAGPTLLNAQPHDRGISAVARQLGVDRKTVREAVALGALTETANTAAQQAGLTRKERIEAALAPDPAARVNEIADRKSKAAEPPRIRSVRVNVETTETTIRAPCYVRDPRVPGNPDRDKVITALNHAKSLLRQARDAAGRLGKGTHIDAVLTKIDDMSESLMTEEDDEGAGSILDHARGPGDTRH